MRGTEETGRYEADLMPRGAGLLADGTRACAGDVAEDTPKRTETSPAGPEGNIGDGQLRIAQQGGRAFDAPREQVAMRRNAKGLFERTREVGRRHATHSRQPLHRPILMRCGVHAVLRTQQAAQQLRSLRRDHSFTRVAH